MEYEWYRKVAKVKLQTLKEEKAEIESGSLAEQVSRRQFVVIQIDA